MKPITFIPLLVFSVLTLLSPLCDGADVKLPIDYWKKS